ncbi:MAG: glycine--tRNA ligase subunit beta, partial [Usitatibacteraceae bacterium]
MSTAPLLVELFTEELPPKALKKLGESFAAGITEGLRKRGLLAVDSLPTTFASPRRLAVHITNVSAVAPDEIVVRKLMPAAVGLDAGGKPTQALTKKLAALGKPDFDVSQLEREGEGKAQQLLLRDMVKGQSLQVALQTALEEAIAGLPVPKVMSYQLADGQTTVQFVRPVHGLVALHGANVVPVHALGHEAGATTHGHRFQGAADIVLKHADEYETRMENEGGVIASFEKRRHETMRLLFAHAEQTGDTLGDSADYEALLDEVTALVERPTVYVGKFDAEFLSVPAECLVLTMKLNQKYFPLFLSEGGLSSRFLIVSNMRLDDPRNVIEGNERVVRPRLSDARFFFETDKKTKLEDRLPKLASVVYHNKLGSQGERVERVRALAGKIAALIGADVMQAERAALLAKADLVTDMVGEFPELQGTMGRYYALHDGEAEVVADAIAQHYQPRFSGDKLPDSLVGVAVALSDKLETLAGLFSIDQVPTGDKDPFALRRHALGVLRMLIERDLPVTVSDLVAFALKSFVSAKPGRADKLVEYIFDRLVGYLRDLGYTTLEVDAVLSVRPPWGELPVRLAAVRTFQKLPEAASLAAANKRIVNILKKAELDFVKVDAGAFVEPAEHELFGAMNGVLPIFSICIEGGDYSSALRNLARLKVPVDSYFDNVMVNVEDQKLRENRLALLSDLHALMNKVADLSKLAA